MPKERIFESAFTITLRQRRNKPKAGSSRPRKTAPTAPVPNTSTAKTTNASRDDETPLHKSLPMVDVTESQDYEQNINPIAIRSQPSPRGHVKKSTTKATRTPLTAEQQRERNRKQAAERRQRLKDNGRCVSCPNNAIDGQTRCPDCAEKHRARLRPYSEARRRAEGAKHTLRIGEAELLQLIQKEVDARESQVANQPAAAVQPDRQSLSRAQRKSLGICSDCDYSSEEGHIRCTLCLLRHRLYARQRRAKAQTVPSTMQN